MNALDTNRAARRTQAAILRRTAPKPAPCAPPKRRLTDRAIRRAWTIIGRSAFVVRARRADARAA